MTGEASNAIAGPSHSHNHAPDAPSTLDSSMSITSPPFSIHATRPSPAPSIPPLYLPPPGKVLFISLLVRLFISISSILFESTRRSPITLPIIIHGNNRDPTPGPPPPQTLLASTQDLLSRFKLLDAYDKYVKNVTPTDEPSSGLSRAMATDQHSTQGSIASVAGAVPNGFGSVDKGKGKEVMVDSPSGAGMPGKGGSSIATEADDDAKAEKKKKNTYKHLIKGIPGKHSMKKDDYLSTMMLVPPKQRIPISKFDARTQRDAFTVSLEGLKGWNIYALVEESPQAKEDRKKRKELRRLAKAQAAAFAAVQQTGSATQEQPAHSSMPTTGQSRPHTAGGTSSNNTGTPRPAGASSPRSGLVASRPGATITATGVVPTPTPDKAHAQSPSTASRPESALPRLKSSVPRPGSTKPPVASVPTALAPSLAKPALNVPVPNAAPVDPPLRSGTPMQVDQQRGIKREREDGFVNGVTVGHGPPATTITNAPSTVVVDAKAGIAGVRPRPIKKQRMVSACPVF
ncbi:hypothetical protein M378DRAFT_268788 [Amanita muscaria Koide BX008]|uniref:Uncharacterized protein n=1 Tax=Amanita muscaria (strain Koide BX008) TaxID=946122 RepID=A0A0C2XDT5_AMAMK|nr:hypothetical protein M378DRAFT_268788 [Amanita muscaria Koide BX008]